MNFQLELGGRGDDLREGQLFPLLEAFCEGNTWSLSKVLVNYVIGLLAWSSLHLFYSFSSLIWFMFTVNIF